MKSPVPYSPNLDQFASKSTSGGKLHEGIHVIGANLFMPDGKLNIHNSNPVS